MQSYRKELWFEIVTRRAFVNTTPDVESVCAPAAVSVVVYTLAKLNPGMPAPTRSPNGKRVRASCSLANSASTRAALRGIFLNEGSWAK